MLPHMGSTGGIHQGNAHRGKHFFVLLHEGELWPDVPQTLLNSEARSARSDMARFDAIRTWG